VEVVMSGLIRESALTEIIIIFFSSPGKVLALKYNFFFLSPLWASKALKMDRNTKSEFFLKIFHASFLPVPAERRTALSPFIDRG